MITLAIVLSATLAAAEIHDPCGAFTVHLKSASNDAMEDDMRVTLAFEDGTAVNVPLASALYETRGTLKNVTNRCRQLAALDVGADRALLLMSRNGRPQWDVLDAVLIDVRGKRILDVRAGVGEIKTEDRVFVVRNAGAASFDVLLIREEIENSGCDCAAAAIEDWMRISVRRDHVNARWR